MSPVYLDNNATTATDAEVVAAMLPWFTERYGNASSSHAFGATAAEGVRLARRQVQSLLGAAHDHEVVFTSGGTESNTTAILSALDSQPGRTEIVTTAVEHPAVLALAAHLEKTRGVTVHTVGVDGEGRLDLDDFERALGPRTALVSIMWANNETGTLFPVAALARQAHAAGALFHTDAVQAVGRVPMRLRDTEIDMLSLSGHKLHGPKGIGALYVRKGVPFRPLMRGGRQERGRRGGTENVPGIVGLGAAAELAARYLETERGWIGDLRDRLEQGVLSRIGHCHVLGDLDHRLANTACIAFDYVDADALLLMLDRAGIAASSGSACASGTMEPSHVLRAMRVPVGAIRGAIRFSLSRDTGGADIDRVLDVLPDIVGRLRTQSPLWRDRVPTFA
ncbi:cysteine desulfurase NifS [Nitrospirillum sp. BR 11828]|uniref:cysteine desulfurase NifS n=1 Tax=Nitrospirillum sp. BR 11828 TaxID=3104325 RepID=UPI002ACA553D|nr:cysteine desulfurase NifS [Nitrospirillum sp. BR 11828]MDZ5649900.1 cysteine desulfurase NifS [Nitrospirillum sp. BR 11828]